MEMKPLYAVVGKCNGRITYRFPYVVAKSEIEAKEMVKDYLLENASDKSLAMIDNTEFFASLRLNKDQVLA